MKSRFSQKTTWLCLVGSLALAMVMALGMHFSADRRAASPGVEEVNDLYPAPAAGEAAPMPPVPAAAPNEGIDESSQDEPPGDFSA